MDAYNRFEHAGVIVEIVGDDEPMSPQDNDNAGTLYSWARDFDGDESIRDPEGFGIACDKCGGYGVDQDDDDCPVCEGTGEVQSGDVARYFAEAYNAALTIPLYFANYGSTGARIYESDNDPNCALVFTQEEINREWSGHIDPYKVEMKNAVDGSLTGEVREYGGARAYAKARIDELDNYLQGNVFGIVVRERTGVSVADTYADADNLTRYRSNDEVIPDDLEVIDAEDDDAGEILESCWGFIGNPDGEWILSEARALAEAASEQVAHEKACAFAWACRDVVTIEQGV
jgi:hypothetical protein